jgi:hypothetical protein
MPLSFNDILKFRNTIVVAFKIFFILKYIKIIFFIFKNYF